MSEIILHHYPHSTFSERVRLAFGLKDLAWRSVAIPPAMPKPDLLALTGGYRRTPVLQIGADIFCDTQVILRRIERLHPAPSLFPDGTEGLATALAWWADKSIFTPALGVLADTIGDRLPADFKAERKAFGFPLGRDDVAPVIDRYRQQGAAHLAMLAAMLADGRPFLLGPPSAADFAAYCSLWLLRNQGGAEAERKLPVAPMRDWYERVAAFGHGRPTELAAADAIGIAREAEPQPVAVRDDGDPTGIAPGTTVTVTPDDTGRDPVRGTLLAADARTVVIHRDGGPLGALNLHFPRAGFDVVAA